MKKIISVLIFVHCFFQIAEGQWIAQNSGTTSFLRDVEFLNRNTGWIVGDNGVILKTTNAGTNWLTIQNPAIGKPLFNIHIIDSNICYVVGWFETIIKTTNGGTNWVVIRNGPFGFGSSYEAVFFINENTGWIAGTGQKVLRTTNGGDSIITDPLFIGNVHDMYFKDALTGIITGSGLSTFKTYNGGLNWTNIVLPIGFVIPTFYKITFSEDEYGWLMGSDNRIFKTTDFGDTWETIYTIPLNPQSISMWFAEFTNSKVGFVGGEQGYLYKSLDGGKSWIRENSGNFSPLLMRSMKMYNDSVGWIVGGGGKIIYTTNGGQSLVNINNSNELILNNFKLYQNYPNPFNPKTIIKYSIKKTSYIKVKIFDIKGSEVETLKDELLTSGNYEVIFDASEINSGVFFYSLFVGGERIETKRMIFLK